MLNMYVAQVLHRGGYRYMLLVGLHFNTLSYVVALKWCAIPPPCYSSDRRILTPPTRALASA